MNRDFSVLLSTYAHDDPVNLDAAIESVVEQTVIPSQIVVIQDGPVPGALRAVIEKWSGRHPDLFDVYQLEQNNGLGCALRKGVIRCEYDLIARMDADDISISDRFEQQLKYLEANPGVDVVGGYIKEFSQKGMTEVRTVPLSHEKIRKRARFRSPMNHVTVLFRQSAVLSAGNYRGTDPLEDYDLWTRMLLDDSTLANIPETLVKVRAGESMYERRGGLSYFQSELRQQVRLLRGGITSVPVFLLNVVVRAIIRLSPNAVRGVVYRRVLRRE